MQAPPKKEAKKAKVKKEKKLAKVY